MTEAGVDLYWLPLGAGGHVVRLSGKAYEAALAAAQRRPRYSLYHSALVITLSDEAHTIEMAPVVDLDGVSRGVVAEGAVGSSWARRFRIFRYEIRCWPGGVIPDLAEAVESPRRLSDDPAIAQRILELVRQAPTPVWGRDELRCREMWNSNSLISWLIVRAGLDVDGVRPPAGGRAPGWDAGIVTARR